MQKNVILGCLAAILSGVFAIATPANAHGRHYGCGCGSGYYGYYSGCYPVYAPPSYTSLYYGTFGGYQDRRYLRWRRR